VRWKARQIAKTPLRGINAQAHRRIPAVQAALRTALVTAMAFAHHEVQEKAAVEAIRLREKPETKAGERCGGD